MDRPTPTPVFIIVARPDLVCNVDSAASTGTPEDEACVQKAQRDAEKMKLRKRIHTQLWSSSKDSSEEVKQLLLIILFGVYGVNLIWGDCTLIPSTQTLALYKSFTRLLTTYGYIHPWLWTTQSTCTDALAASAAA